MILAAGRGERLRPLTDTIPKPLVKIQHKALIVHHIERLRESGFANIIINTSYLANKIHAHLGDGSQFGVKIRYSDEGDNALETGGGIVKALELMHSKQFLVINGDVFCDVDFRRLSLPPKHLAHLVLTANPAHHPNGDFCLDENQHIGEFSQNLQNYTFSGIGLYDRELFRACKVERFALKTVLLPAIAQKRVSGEIHHGQWTDVGTLARLNELQQQLGDN